MTPPSGGVLIAGITGSIATPFAEVGQVSQRFAPHMYTANQLEVQAQQLSSRVQQRASRDTQTPPQDPAKEDGAGADATAIGAAGGKAVPDEGAVAPHDAEFAQILE